MVYLCLPRASIVARLGIVSGLIGIHHRIGFLNHFLDGFAAIIAIAIADGATIDGLGHILFDGGNQSLQFLFGRLTANNHEFIAADALNRLFNLRGFGEAKRDSRDGFVASEVALVIVDGF